jgi:hypothetical protein
MPEIVNPDARSPYQKYGKTPYRYSQQYREWINAFKTGNHREQAKAHSDWCKRFAPTETHSYRSKSVEEIMPEGPTNEA